MPIKVVTAPLKNALKNFIFPPNKMVDQAGFEPASGISFNDQVTACVLCHLHHRIYFSRANPKSPERILSTVLLSFSSGFFNTHRIPNYLRSWLLRPRGVDRNRRGQHCCWRLIFSPLDNSDGEPRHALIIYLMSHRLQNWPNN